MSVLELEPWVAESVSGRQPVAWAGMLKPLGAVVAVGHYFESGHTVAVTELQPVLELPVEHGHIVHG